jgi:hypothetical protein
VSASNRLAWALGVALAAHAGAFAWAYVRRPAVLPPATTMEPLDVTVDVEPPPPAEPPAEATEAPLDPAAVARLDRRAAVVAHTVPGAATGEPTQTPAASSEPATADGTWTFSPGTGSSASVPAGPLGGGALAEATRAGVAAVVAEETRKDAARQQRLATFSPHDIQLGLVPGGVLATLSRELVRRSRVPVISHAILQFDTDGAGLVASFRVLDASDGRAEWSEVAAQIAADARARPLAVPNGARGVAVTVEVTSKLKTVNGGDPNASAVSKALGAINDPIGTASAGPPVRVIASHIVDVRAF